MTSQPQSDHIETSGMSKTLKKVFFFFILKQRYWALVSLVPEVEGGVEQVVTLQGRPGQVAPGAPEQPSEGCPCELGSGKHTHRLLRGT